MLLPSLLVLAAVAAEECLETSLASTASLLQRRKSEESVVALSQEQLSRLEEEIAEKVQQKLLDRLEHLKDSTPVAAPVPTPKREEKHIQGEDFEFCQKAKTNILSEVGADVNHTETSVVCDDETEVPLFSPKDSSPYYEVQCCPAQATYCAGCAKLNSGGTSCATCSGGYVMSSNKCVACVDLPWENAQGENCHAASCSNSRQSGFSSNAACCKCGGGQRAATPFQYYVGPMAIGSSQVVGHPIPRTASQYAVDKDCEMAKFGLRIDPTSGKLERTAGCSTVGCGLVTSFEVKCSVTALQADGLSASAPLVAMVGELGYGSGPVVLRGSNSAAPVTAPGLSGSFSLACSPEAQWLSVSSSGVLSLASGSGGEVTDSSGTTLGRGAVCSIAKGTGKAHIPVLAPQKWNSMSYSYGGSTVLYATVGERSPVLPVMSSGSGVPPTRFSADCADSSFAFDQLSGVATFKGHEIFALDVKSGTLQLQPEHSLVKALDSQSGVRRKISLSCTVFGHYEWQPAGQGPVLTHRLSLELRDGTCWASKVLSFASRVDKGSHALDACRALCRSDPFCSHFQVASKCYFYQGVCKDSSHIACSHKDVSVLEHYPGCGERSSCIDVKIPNFHYVSGKYCPRGENALTDSQGPVYFKQGLTTKETFWLQKFATWRSRCSLGDWAIYKPNPAKDYENLTSSYVELHGGVVACLSGATDLASDVFSSTSVQLTVSYLTTGSATARVAAPGCSVPNITSEEEEEEEEKQSVFPLVLDDPSTDIVDDHWLHPCQCVPASWGSEAPVKDESAADIPAGSNNEFLHLPFPIVEGEFVCEQENMLSVHVMSEDEMADSADCKSKCKAQSWPPCTFFWEGEVMSTKQCRLYSACSQLVREVGSMGILYGMTYRKACRIADPETCWSVTKRRSFLGAGTDSYPCLYEDLLQQCDHKLMLGGFGVAGCGKCQYAPVEGRKILSYNGKCLKYADDQNVQVATCSTHKNQKWFFEGEAIKTDVNDDCLDYNTATGNVRMHTCSGNNNQLWYFEDGHLKSRHDGKCLDFFNANSNVYVGNCPGSDTMHWAWKQEMHDGQKLISDHNGLCLKHQSDNTFRATSCSKAFAHRFYFVGELLKSEKDSSMCVEHVSSTGEVRASTCQSGNNFKWYWQGKLLKSRTDGRCLDFLTHSYVVRVGSCPNSDTQRWNRPSVFKDLPAAKMTSMHSATHCWNYNPNTGDVYMRDPCHDGDNQKWYFDGEAIKTPDDTSKCLDEASSGNLYMNTCHSGDNQKFYWDGARIKNKKWDGAKCIDYGYGDGKIYMHSCHSGANQMFNLWTPQRLSTENSGKCLEKQSDNNVVMRGCKHTDNQQWYFEGPILRNKDDTSQCLDMRTSGDYNLYMGSCHGGDNQDFVWSGELVKSVHDSSICWKWMGGSNKNVEGKPCDSSSDLFKWYFHAPVHKGKLMKSDYEDSCMDWDNGNARVYMSSNCHKNSNQRWYFVGEGICVESLGDDKCLDYDPSVARVYMNNCHGGNNQKWYFDGKLLRSRYDHRCLDFNPHDKKAYVTSCPDSNTLEWTAGTDIHNSVQLISDGNKCLFYDSSGDKNVEASGCSEADNKLWYFDSSDRLKTEQDNRCIDYHYGTSNYYMHNCHSGQNQKFYWDGKHLRDKYDDFCMDYHVANGNVRSGTCQDKQNNQWTFEGGAMLKKTPIPTSFSHGQTLEVSCWSERFSSTGSDKLSCVAGSWVNSRGSLGLEGFSCKACVQVVSPKYADLDSQIRQELFFAAGLKLHLTVDTRTVRTVTATGGLRTGGTKDIFVAELMDGAGETLRRFRSITSSGNCLAEVGGSLTAEACTSEAEPTQLMEASELSSLLWEEYKASADVPGSQSSALANRGSAPTTLRSFQVEVDCGFHALTSLGFNHGAQLGMSGDCTAASTYGALVGPVTLDVPGHVTITSASHGTCMSINHVIPWTLTTVHNSKCLDYAFGTDANNVYSHNCHGNDNQQWYMVNGNIYSLHDAKCLDYHTGTDNVYMHDCHDGSNQKWYFDEDTKAIRSEYDHRCLDVAGTDNVYVQTCHFQTNQQWDRHETTGKAFELALQMPCSGSAAESITVEPIGSHQKFRLKSQGHTLDGEYKFSSNKKIERVDVANKCMEADYQLSGVDQETCVDSLEQEWVIGHGLQGLADAPIACVGNQVISYFEKTSSQIRYKCVHVSSLGMCSPGYSEQVDTKSLELEDVKSLRLMTATCPVGHGLRSLMAEASDKGAWIRLRYECCQISRVPVTVYPYLLSSELRDFDTGMANAWEGVYCPTSLDSSGRMQFSQSRSFKPGQNPSGTLTYDKFQGQWCVTGKTCATSDIVHPLDSPLVGGSEWRVVPVSDFDAQFEARGVKPIGGNRKRKPPPLIKFGATDPEYLPECKDESHPGTRKFKLEIMNSEAESLDDENPCKYVFGKSPSDKSLEDAEGMTGWKDDLKGNTGAGVGGVTYKSVKECADREITRELRMANWAEDHFNKTNGLDFTRDFLSGIADIYPAAEAAPLGAGFEFHPGALIYLIGHMAINGAEMGYNRQLQNREMKYEEVGHDDCNSIQHGFARTFCDLHCIRDAVRKGNDAILRAMEEAVEVIGKNTQILLEHYVGESSGSGLLQEGKRIQEGIQHHVAEMAELASSALEPKASLLAQRALSSFAQRWGEGTPPVGRWHLASADSNSSGLLQEVRDLHSTLALLSQRKLSQTEEVQQRALEMAGHMGKFLEVKAHMLGVYRQRAHAGKFIQRWLRTNFRQVTASDVLSEMEEQAAERAMEEFDTMWWEIRQELDTYLQASQDYVDATNSAVQMLHSYTSECQAGFSALKQSYALSARAEKKAHEALKKTWSTVSVRMGAMASKVMDGALLERLATHDIQHIDVGSLMASHHQPCSSDALGVVETAVKVAMKKGVFGQTYWQLKELLEEMAMLQQRFAVHGQNAPDASTLTEAAARFTQATKQTTSARERLARKMLAHWQQGAC